MKSNSIDKPVLARTPEQCITRLRGQAVLLDTDLAALYGVTVKRLNQQVTRNRERFPEDFCFQLTETEWRSLRLQNETLKRGQHRKYMPYVFTEHGSIMAATVLNSPRAVQMSVFVVRAFVAMRAVLMDTGELARKLTALESEVKARLDSHDAAIVDILARIMDLIAPPEVPDPPPKKIGFGVHERPARYRARPART